MSAKSGPRVLIIIVNWNGERYLGSCIEAAMANNYPNIDILVVDNASTDGSIGVVARYPSVGLIQLPENKGWGSGINAGLASDRARLAHFYLCMNNDVNLDQNAVQALVACAERHRDFGILSPTLLNRHGAFTHSGGFFTHLGWWKPHIVGEGSGDLTELDIVIGAAMFVRREVVAKIGGFDPEFFLYREDVDYCRRAKHYGFRVGVVHRARAVHVGGATTTKVAESQSAESMTSPDLVHVYAVSCIKYAFKHLTTAQLLRWLLTARGRSSWYLVPNLWPSLARIRKKGLSKVEVGA